MTSCWRYNEVIITSCVQWVIAFLTFVEGTIISDTNMKLLCFLCCLPEQAVEQTVSGIWDAKTIMTIRWCHRDGTGRSKPSSCTRTLVYYVVNTIAVDYLVTQGARASASMVLTMGTRTWRIKRTLSSLVTPRHMSLRQPVVPTVSKMLVSWQLLVWE